VKQRIEIEVDVPDGFEATGDYRRPSLGEYYLGGFWEGKREVFTCDLNRPNVAETFILRRKAPVYIEALYHIRYSLKQTNPHSHLIEIADNAIQEWMNEQEQKT
jgi:hypothetical protein